MSTLVIEATREQMLDDDYDWRSAFGAADAPVAVPGSSVAADPFTIEDIAEVIASSLIQGAYAETDVACVLRLNDGRFASLTASCDTTGWDCQAGGTSQVAGSLAEIVRLGLSDPTMASSSPNGRTSALWVTTIPPKRRTPSPTRRRPCSRRAHRRGSRADAARHRSRNFARRADVDAFIDSLPPDTVVVTGCATRGVDLWARIAADRRGLICVEVHAPWYFHGNRAGPMRNPVIAWIAERLIAFRTPAGTKSNGTDDVVSWADELGKVREVRS